MKSPTARKSLTSALVALLLSGAPLPDEIGAALEARAATSKKPPINQRTGKPYAKRLTRRDYDERRRAGHIILAAEVPRLLNHELYGLGAWYDWTFELDGFKGAFLFPDGASCQQARQLVAQSLRAAEVPAELRRDLLRSGAVWCQDLQVFWFRSAAQRAEALARCAAPAASAAPAPTPAAPTPVVPAPAVPAPAVPTRAPTPAAPTPAAASQLRVECERRRRIGLLVPLVHVQAPEPEVRELGGIKECDRDGRLVGWLMPTQEAAHRVRVPLQHRHVFQTESPAHIREAVAKIGESGPLLARLLEARGLLPKEGE